MRDASRRLYGIPSGNGNFSFVPDDGREGAKFLRVERDGMPILSDEVLDRVALVGCEISVGIVFVGEWNSLHFSRVRG
jgi:hypothetical protein